jgi:hypothetical protein
MAITPDTVRGETKSERVGMAVTPTELLALEFIQKLHGDRYDGASSVLRDYSLADAVAFYERAKAAAK